VAKPWEGGNGPCPSPLTVLFIHRYNQYKLPYSGGLYILFLKLFFAPPFPLKNSGYATETMPLWYKMEMKQILYYIT